MKYVEVMIKVPTEELIKDAQPDLLVTMQNMLAAQAKLIKDKQAQIDREIESRYMEKAKAAYKDKTHGKAVVEQFTIPKITPDDNNVTIVIANVTKKVEYTQTTLRALFGSLPIADAMRYIDVSFHVSEANYPKFQLYLAAQGTPELQKMLEDSRVVKYSAPKLSLESDCD